MRPLPPAGEGSAKDTIGKEINLGDEILVAHGDHGYEAHLNRGKVVAVAPWRNTRSVQIGCQVFYVDREGIPR